jgi:hypothetical protein
MHAAAQRRFCSFPKPNKMIDDTQGKQGLPDSCPLVGFDDGSDHFCSRGKDYGGAG